MKTKKNLDPELLISLVLRWGVSISAVVMSIGIVLVLVTGTSGNIISNFPTNIREVIAGLISLNPVSIITFGLLLLIATPIFRVASTILIFLNEKDYPFIIITSVVFFILVFSLILGKEL